MSNIRDQELKRLEAYANSLGVKVVYRKKDKVNPTIAEFYTDGSGITVYTRPGLSKTQLLLNLLHELGHAVHWVHRGKTTNTDLFTALHMEEKRKKGEVIDVKYRKLIYEDEHHATHFWDQIVKLVDIKINPDVILLSKKLDIFAYRYYFETGEFPSVKIYNEKKKEFKNEQTKKRFQRKSNRSNKKSSKRAR